MSSAATVSSIWPLPVAVVSAIAIFSGTFFAYAEQHRLHRDGSYQPAVFGIALFAVVMLLLTVATLPRGRRRVGLVLVVVVSETAAFACALMFLLLNIYGS